MNNLGDARYWQWVASKRAQLSRGLLDLAMSSIRPDRRRTYELAAQHEQQQSDIAAMKARYFLALDS